MIKNIYVITEINFIYDKRKHNDCKIIIIYIRIIITYYFFHLKAIFKKI